MLWLTVEFPFRGEHLIFSLFDHLMHVKGFLSFLANSDAERNMIPFVRQFLSYPFNLSRHLLRLLIDLKRRKLIAADA